MRLSEFKLIEEDKREISEVALKQRNVLNISIVHFCKMCSNVEQIVVVDHANDIRIHSALKRQYNCNRSKVIKKACWCVYKTDTI